MSCEIVNFPRQPVRLTVVASNPQITNFIEAAVYQSEKLLDAAFDLAGASAEITNAQMVLKERGCLPEGDATMNGETLESVLEAAMALIKLGGCRNRDRALTAELRNWLLANGGRG
jgi:hypothetical protein